MVRPKALMIPLRERTFKAKGITDGNHRLPNSQLIHRPQWDGMSRQLEAQPE